MMLSMEMERRIFNAMKMTTSLAPTETVVSICAWCPDSKQRTDALVKEGKAVSHGMCVPCSVRLMSEVK